VRFKAGSKRGSSGTGLASPKAREEAMRKQHGGGTKGRKGVGTDYESMSNEALEDVLREMMPDIIPLRVDDDVRATIIAMLILLAEQHGTKK
jgi:hypothetical protein